MIRSSIEMFLTHADISHIEYKLLCALTPVNQVQYYILEHNNINSYVYIRLNTQYIRHNLATTKRYYQVQQQQWQQLYWYPLLELKKYTYINKQCLGYPVDRHPSRDNYISQSYQRSHFDPGQLKRYYARLHISAYIGERAKT